MVRKHGRLIITMLALVFVLVACAPASAQPMATPAPTVVPTITPDAAQPLVLVLPAVDDQKTLIAVNRHYSDAVKRKGWNVEFYTVQSSNADGMESYLPYINKQLCSGAARADGFICMKYLSRTEDDPLLEAKVNGQLYDCVAAAPQAVPQYWAKYHDQITAGKYGLVLAGRPSPVRIDDPVLVVRKDVLPLVGEGISDYDGLRALIAQLERTHPKNAYVEAYPQQLLSLWTEQQGYLELFADAGIYARIDDPDANPVMLEDIPGISQFFQDIVAMQARGLLRDSQILIASDGDVLVARSQPRVGEEALGPAAALDYAYDLLYMHNAHDGLWKGYTAFPLVQAGQYADTIDEAQSASSLSRITILRELIIPARSRRAADAMAFIQWIYADRRNADAVIYGQEGSDYTLQGERVALLGDAASHERQNMPSWLNWTGSSIFQSAAERRIYADAPDNAESLLSVRTPKPLAAPWLAHIYDTEAWGKQTIRDSMGPRKIAINITWNLMQQFPGAIFDIDLFLKDLRAGATDSALQPYLDVLAEARTTTQP